jgi:hypothetical protein
MRAHRTGRPATRSDFAVIVFREDDAWEVEVLPLALRRIEQGVKLRNVPIE